MHRLLSNPALIVTVAATSIWVVLVNFAPVDPLNYILRVGIATVGVATLIRWGPTAWRVYLEGAKAPEDSAILAVVLMAGSYLWYVGWTATSRYLGGPDFMMNSPWSAFFPYLALISFVLAIVSTRLKGERTSGLITFVLAAGTMLGLGATAIGHLLIAKLGGILTLLARLF